MEWLELDGNNIWGDLTQNTRERKESIHPRRQSLTIQKMNSYHHVESTS